MGRGAASNGAISGKARATVTQQLRNNLWIGRNTFSNTYLPGKINSVKIWNSALSDGQVAELYADAACSRQSQDSNYTHVFAAGCVHA